jgi:predicted porin
MGGNAMAQNTVTLYGTLDQYLGFSKSGPSHSTRLDDGGNTASRLGFSGSEDLGGGLRANFLLEAGFSPDTGGGTLPGPGLAFTRQSFVGLSNDWGRIDAGRMYTPLFYSLLRADPFNINSVYSPLNLISANDAQPGLAAFTARASNMLRYRTPAENRLVLDLAYAPGEASALSHRSGDMYGGNIGWNQKPFYISRH